jgi:hypothetical protein
MSKEFTYQDVAEHNTKKDLFVVIHDKVYDVGPFVDEHPYVPLIFPLMMIRGARPHACMRVELNDLDGLFSR